nr:sugar ABC transporter substrate-binding protein [uncultured Agathobaculum sp.]
MKQILKRLTAGVLLAAAALAGTAFGASRETVLTVGVVAGSYWDAPTGNCYAVIDAAIARFEQAHPDVRVEYTSGILKRDYSEWLTDQYLLGREPDVFMVLPEDFGMLAEQGALQPLDNLLASDAAVSTADFYEAALQSGAAGGVQYALPYECVPTLMFVNKTLLEAENIPVPNNDWTWDDFYEICAQVTRDTDGDGTIDQFGSYGYTWRDALAANGAALFDENGSSCLIAQPASVEAVGFAQRLEELYADCDITARSFDEGHVAFRPFLFSDYRTYQPYPWRIKRYSDFEWDCIQMPGGPYGTGRSELSTVLAAISSRSSKQALAWEFLKELTCSDETQSMLYTDSHGVSALRRVTQSPQTQQILRQDTPGESQLGLEILSDAMEQAVAAPHFRAYDQALLLAESLVATAMEDDHNLSLQLQRVQRELEEYLRH